MSSKILPGLGLALAAGIALPAAMPAAAAVTTGSLLVSATVLDTCLVAATPLAFGNLSATTSTTELVPSTVLITCTAAKPTVSVTVDGGANASGGVRQMSDGAAARIPYAIYADSARANAVAVGGAIYQGSVAAIVPTAVSVYGAVAAGTYASGLYTDSATITVNY